jgi:hypothetical protein
MQALRQGPVAVYWSGDTDFVYYSGGLYIPSFQCNSSKVNHASESKSSVFRSYLKDLSHMTLSLPYNSNLIQTSLSCTVLLLVGYGYNNEEKAFFEA